MRNKLFHSTSFHLTMFASLAFVAVGAAIIGFFYWSMLSAIDGQIDAAITRDCADVAAAYRTGGYAGLRSLITARASRQPEATRIYVLRGPDGEYIGNLASWPGDAPPPGERADIRVSEPPMTARVRTLTFAGGIELLLGRTLTERQDLRATARKSLISVCIANLLLGSAAGALIARYASRRLETINSAAYKVLDGDLSVRAEIFKGGDEYDHLAGNFNAMLDRIQRLIATVHGVTENIAHDLRAPLNRMRGRLELALMSPRTPEEYRAVLDRAISETESIVKTFDGMLKIGRLTSRSLDFPQQRVDLAEVAEELFDLYYDFAEENNVALEIQLPSSPNPPPVIVLGDGHLISQAAANLLDNAIKYSPEGGRVSISVTAGAEGVSLIFTDAGPGIPEVQRAVILDRFVRLEVTSSKPGYGLGLSFAFAVAEWHKAELSLADNAPGLRATLTFKPAPIQST